MNNQTEDFLAKGFHRIDEKFIERRPPKINWGEKYKAWPDDRKIQYLEKLAATMNHAARLVQEERNALQTLCGKKEEQLMKMSEALDANNAMLHSQLSKINEERQSFNAAAVEKNTRIRELERGSVSQ